ncbi:MAG TPA: hypothetical protein VKI17_08040, partial [Gemmataceae bacterium]|nr:hypothetical protein [Gemmataceae bacterium]
MFTNLGRAFRHRVGQPLWQLAAAVIPDQPRRKRSWLHLRKAIALWLGRDKTTVWLTCDQPNLHGNESLQVAGPTIFRGWALSMRGIASVSFTCDGMLLGEACRGVPRPDVVA